MSVVQTTDQTTGATPTSKYIFHSRFKPLHLFLDKPFGHTVKVKTEWT